MDIFRKRRTIRRYKQKPITKEQIEDLIDCARLAPSAANLQPLKYIAVNDETLIKNALKYLHWAGYVRPHRDPSENTKPTALILVCHDKKISNSGYVAYDVGAAVQTILLSATDKGLGACWLGAIDKEPLRELFDIPLNWQLHCVIALGWPDESPVVEEAKNGDIRYYLDENDQLYVPKRNLLDVMRWANE